MRDKLGYKYESAAARAAYVTRRAVRCSYRARAAAAPKSPRIRSIESRARPQAAAAKERGPAVAPHPAAIVIHGRASGSPNAGDVAGRASTASTSVIGMDTDRFFPSAQLMLMQQRQRKISKVPFKVLDAPQLQDDRKRHLIC